MNLRILLIQPASNIMNNRKEGKPALLPLGLMSIAGTLRKYRKDDKIEILDVMTEGFYNEKVFRKDYIRYGLSPKEIRDKIKEFKPDIVGVSCMASIRKYHAYEICKLAKEVDPSIITVIGGNHITCFPKEAIRRLYIDFAILGEGEKSFLELVNLLDESLIQCIGQSRKIYNLKFKDLDVLNGIAFKYNKKSIIKPQKYWEEDIDNIPFPAHDLINLKMYSDIWNKEGYQTYKARKYTMSLMARGCPNSCRHCPHNVIFPGYRSRSAANLFEEVKWCYDLGIREIQYHEYNGIVNWKIVEEFCNLMIESGMNKEMRWGWPIGIWLKRLTRDRLKLMREAGMDYICLAIESSDQSKLDEVMKGKDVDLDHTLNVIKWCREFDYQIHSFFMLGLEGQTKKDIEHTIDFAKNLDIDSASFFIAQPLPGTPFWDHCKEKKLFLDGFDTFHLRYGKVNHKVEGITPSELEEYRHRARKEFIKKKGDRYLRIKEECCE